MTMKTAAHTEKRSSSNSCLLFAGLRIALELDMRLRRSYAIYLVPSALLLALALSASAQSGSPSPDGIESGNYNIRQTIEFGYRATDVSGNQANYDTFVNLHDGARLFEQSLDVRSLNHTGLFF